MVIGCDTTGGATDLQYVIRLVIARFQLEELLLRALQQDEPILIARYLYGEKLKSSLIATSLSISAASTSQRPQYDLKEAKSSAPSQKRSALTAPSRSAITAWPVDYVRLLWTLLAASSRCAQYVAVMREFRDARPQSRGTV